MAERDRMSVDYLGIASLLTEIVSGCERRLLGEPDDALYFMQVGGIDGPVKIGSASDPMRRRRNLQSGNHQDITFVLLTAGGSSAERAAHSLFASSRIRGEWFRCDGMVPGVLHALRHMALGAEQQDWRMCQRELLSLLSMPIFVGHEGRLDPVSRILVNGGAA